MRAGLIVVFIAFCEVARAETSGCTNPDTAQVERSPTHWLLVKAEQVSIPPVGTTDVRLWRSRETVACSGAGNSLHAVRVVATFGNRVLYRYESPPTSEELWTGKSFDLEDVLSIGTPQIIFETGESAASDWEYHVHVVPLAGTKRYMDVAPATFSTSWRQTLNWFSSSTKRYAVLAVPEIKDDDDIGHSCHGCPHRYRYEAYSWDQAASSWKLVTTVLANREFDGSVDPFSADLSFIQKWLP